MADHRRPPRVRRAPALAALAAVAAFGLACGGDGGGAAAPAPTMAPAARAYLDAALDIMQRDALNRRRVNWPALRAGAHEIAAAAQRPADTHLAIAAALRGLGDGHSHLRDPAGTIVRRLAAPAAGAQVAWPSGRLIGGRFGYLDIPAFGSLDADEGILFARDAHDVVRELAPQACGWVVDLRTNFGGNMWPMLAAVGVVLGDGVAGHFVDADGGLAAWEYREGTTAVQQPPGSGRRFQTSVPAAPPTLDPLPPVAVLTGINTASSGEAIAIAFRGRPGARSFGAPTQGLSTGNRLYRLSDGAQLLLTTVVMADRDRQPYGTRVLPDVPVAETAALDAALAWLATEPACAG